MSDVPFEETNPNPEQQDPPEFYARPQRVRTRRELLADMTRDAESYADRVDHFGPPRTGGSIGVVGSVNAAGVTIGSAFADYMADLLYTAAKGDEDSLRAMGAQADGRDVVFELETPVTGLFERPVTHRLRVLLRADPPVSVEALIVDGALTRFGGLAEVVGKAMAECADKINKAARELEAADDGEVF